MDKAYYTKYYNFERNHWWFIVREKIILDSVQKISTSFQKKPINILNIGCATGRSSEALSKFGAVTSIEYDQDCCLFASEKTGLPIIHGSILELPFHDSSFDMVCAFDVIEHVEDDVLAIKEMYRVCKDDGYILVTVPAFMGLWSEHDVVNHHYRRYKKKEIEKLFSSYNITVCKSSYFNSFLYPPILLFRQMTNIFKSKTPKNVSDFEVINEKSIINKILFYVFSLERLVLKKISFPAGVSFLYVTKK